MQRSIGPVPMFVIHRIEGALGPFIESLSVALQKIFPLPHGKISEPLDSLPPPRVAIDDIALSTAIRHRLSTIGSQTSRDGTNHQATLARQAQSSAGGAACTALYVLGPHPPHLIPSYPPSHRIHIISAKHMGKVRHPSAPDFSSTSHHIAHAHLHAPQRNKT